MNLQADKPLKCRFTSVILEQAPCLGAVGSIIPQSRSPRAAMRWYEKSRDWAEMRLSYHWVNCSVASTLDMPLDCADE